MRPRAPPTPPGHGRVARTARAPLRDLTNPPRRPAAQPYRSPLPRVVDALPADPIPAVGAAQAAVRAGCCDRLGEPLRSISSIPEGRNAPSPTEGRALLQQHVEEGVGGGRAADR